MHRCSLFFLFFCPLHLLWAAGLAAQQPPEVQRFEEVKEVRITPEDFNGNLTLEDPKTTFLHSLGTPTRLRPAQRTALARKAHGALMEVVTITTPSPPFAPTPQLHKGHAVWVLPPATPAHPSPKPVLIATHLWLKGAQEIWVRPLPPFKEDRQPPKVTTLRPGAASATRLLQDFRQAQHLYAKAQAVGPDPWRDLVVLRPAAGVEAGQALGLFDTTTDPLVQLFGYSPFLNPALQDAGLEMRKDENPALAYYFFSRFPATLGAPLIDAEGRLVMLTSLCHYKDPQLSLVIPPKSLRQFVLRTLDSQTPNP